MKKWKRYTHRTFKLRQGGPGMPQYHLVPTFDNSLHTTFLGNTDRHLYLIHCFNMTVKQYDTWNRKGLFSIE